VSPARADRQSGPGAADVPRLGKVLLMAGSPALRSWAARSLGECGRAAAYAYLRRALWDPEEGVRLEAVRAIGSLAVSQSAAELAAVYAWSGPRLRRGILRAARQCGAGSDFDGLLRLAAEDPDRGVRTLAHRTRSAGVLMQRRA
jgi:HEAT repeat protein